MKIIEAVAELRAGILENDRNRVVEGFFLLTGEYLVDTMPEPEIWSDDSVPREIRVYTDPTPIVEEVVEVPSNKEPRQKEDFSMFQTNNEKPRGRSEPVKASGKNRFNPKDFGGVEDENPNIIDNVQPVARTREKAERYTVDCSDCNKTLEITSIEAGKIFAPGSLYNQTGEYRCDLLKCTKKCPNKV